MEETTDDAFVAQIEAEHCQPLAPPERMPQYIRDELPDELAAHRLQAWADARVAAERDRAHNAGFVEASRMHDQEIERLRSVLVECQAHLACNAVTENLVALYGRVRAALGPNDRVKRAGTAPLEQRG